MQYFKETRLEKLGIKCLPLSPHNFCDRSPKRPTAVPPTVEHTAAGVGGIYVRELRRDLIIIVAYLDS